MKLFFTAKDLNVGGIETSLIFLLNKLSKNGHEIDLLLYNSGELENILDKSINIFYYKDYFKNPLKNRMYKFNKNVLVKKLYNRYKNIINKEYDISVAYYGFDNYLDMFSASVNSKKKIIWVHNDFYSAINNKSIPFAYRYMYKLMSKKFKYFDNIVCVSKYTRNNFIKLFGYENETCIIHNYMDDKFIKNNSNIEDLVFDKNTFNIVSVGRLTKLKNFDKVILLGSKLKEKNIDFHIYIVGDGEERKNLQELIIQLDLNAWIDLLGNKGNKVYSIIKNCDLLLSMSSYESFGNVLIESMILGTPYLSNVNSGSKDIYENFTDNNSGEIIKNEYMLDEIIDIIKKPKRKIKFDIESYNRKIDSDLEELLK